MAPPLGATATTAASGGNREELLGPRPAGCERQRSRRWEPQPGLGERSETERARTLTEMYKRGDSIALTKDLLIAARRLSGDGLALSVCFADTSPKGRGSLACPVGAKKPPPHGDGQTFRSIYNDAFSNASPAAFCKASMEMVQRAARSASEPSAGMSATSFSVLPLR